MRLVLAVLAIGCGARSTRDPALIGPPDGLGEVPGQDGAPDAERPDGVDPDVSFWIQLGRIEEVDLLVMVDNSNSMREEQANLTANYPTLVEVLTDPPDEDGNGAPDWPAARSMHVGVISSDMGTSGYPITTCDNAERGDDGVLQNLPASGIEGCDDSYPRFLTFDAAVPDPNLEKDFECIATLGTGGCGFEQQLFAVEKALTVHARPGAANEGFLRPESLLAVLIVTDEEDCSVADPTIFGDDDSLGTLSGRCFNNPEMRQPVVRYVDMFLSLRPRNDRLVLAGILGVPPDLVALSDADLASNDIMQTATFDEILADPRMIETVDYSPEGGGNRLVPSCDVPGLGVAFPPRRIVETIRDVDAVANNGIVQSICQADWSDSMRAITRVIQRHLEAPACTSSPMEDGFGNEANPGDVLACAVYETKWDGSPCGSGSIDRGTVGSARVCQICQQGQGGVGETDAFGLDVSRCSGGEGWTYDPEAPGCPAGGLIEFAGSAAPDPRSPVYLECVWPPAG